jgi:hypothetical protein
MLIKNGILNLSIGTHPFRDVVPIPYSKQALDSYYIIIHGLRQILKDMVNNRIICIQRNLTGLIPNERYNLSNLSSQEAHSMKKMVENFYAINPAQRITISSNYSLTLKREKTAWYLNIREFLNQCKKIKDLEDAYNSELQ